MDEAGALSKRRRCLIEFRLLESTEGRGGGVGVRPKASGWCGESGIVCRLLGTLLLLLLLL